jgi:hypothetical protein
MPSRNPNRRVPLNQCCGCGEDFASLAAFDAHFLSKRADPEFDCMRVLELKRTGWIEEMRAAAGLPRRWWLALAGSATPRRRGG